MQRLLSFTVFLLIGLVLLFSPKVTTAITCPVNNSCCSSSLQSCSANGKDTNCPQGFQWCYSGVCVSEKYDPLTNNCPQILPSPTPSSGSSCPVNNSCCTENLQKCTKNGKDDTCPVDFQWCYSGFCVSEDYDPSTNNCSSVQPSPSLQPSPSISSVPSSTPTPKPSTTPTPIPVFNLPLGCPVTGRITVPYGYNILGYSGNNAGCTGLASCHNGIDISSLTGTAISATMDGVVTESRWDLYKGNYISITNSSTGITTIFEHMNMLSPFRVGNDVKRGQTVGYVGRTGTGVTGPHLHYKLQRGSALLNPFRFLKISNPDPLLNMTADALVSNNYRNLLPLGVGHNLSNWGMCIK